jgi:chemotaxis receptor (MCP) glutamine deamidase CheD
MERYGNSVFQFCGLKTLAFSLQPLAFPRAFTEHGAIMAATVLKSAGAAFVRLGIKLAGGKNILANMLMYAIMSV